MTLTELKYIVAVARARHFGHAAESCFVAQPTLSVAIKKLEDELGVTLFERGGSEVSVTPLGAQIVAQAERVLEQTAAIKELAKQNKDPLSGPLRLGVIYTIGPYLLPPLVKNLIDNVPQMPLVLQENFTVKLLDLLRQGELDAAIMALPLPEHGMAVQPLYDEPFVVAMPKTHPWARRKDISAEDLKSETMLLLGAGHCFRDQVLEVCPEMARFSSERGQRHAAHLRGLVAGNDPPHGRQRHRPDRAAARLGAGHEGPERHADLRAFPGTGAVAARGDRLAQEFYAQGGDRCGGECGGGVQAAGGGDREAAGGGLTCVRRSGPGQIQPSAGKPASSAASSSGPRRGRLRSQPQRVTSQVSPTWRNSSPPHRVTAPALLHRHHGLSIAKGTNSKTTLRHGLVGQVDLTDVYLTARNSRSARHCPAPARPEQPCMLQLAQRMRLGPVVALLRGPVAIAAPDPIRSLRTKIRSRRRHP
jgi:DNA-binding transcriptional LysR family regulator